jgi:hypothetical protein
MHRVVKHENLLHEPGDLLHELGVLHDQQDDQEDRVETDEDHDLNESSLNLSRKCFQFDE